MTLKTWTLAVLFAGSLAACAPNNGDDSETPSISELPTPVEDADVKAFLDFAKKPYVDANAREADLTSLAASLPDYAAISWDTKAFDAESGATVFGDLSISFGTEPQVGLRFEEAKLWGYDDSLLVDRLNGQRLSESGPLLTRLEGVNASYFGVDVAFNALFDTIFAELDDDLPEGFEFGFDRLENATEKVVISGVDLLPWEYSPLPSETLAAIDEDIPPMVTDAIHTAQWLIAIGRSLSIDTSISENTEVTLELRQPGAELSAAFSVELSAAKGLRGFDVEKSVTQGYRSSQTSTSSGETIPGEVITLSGFPAGFVMVQAEAYDTSSISDLRLDKLMGYAARSELPDMNERDLLSLGTWLVTNYRAELNDNEIFTADRGFFSADQFEWLIPSDVRMEFDGAKLNTGELTAFFYTFFELGVLSTVPEGDEETQAEMELVAEGIQKAIELMPEHGLDEIPFDFSASAKWESDSGPTDFAVKFDAEGFGISAFDLSISLPTYDALKAAYDAEDREAAFETAFEEAFAFRGARFFEQDNGGYDKLFGFANALGKEYPDEGWGAMLGNMEPAQLRTYLGTMMRMGKPAAAEEFPPAADWIEAYASYLESGGSFELKSQPPTPITPELLDSYDDEPEPEQIVDILGLTVTHTK